MFPRNDKKKLKTLIVKRRSNIGLFQGLTHLKDEMRFSVTSLKYFCQFVVIEKSNVSLDVLLKFNVILKSRLMTFWSFEWSALHFVVYLFGREISGMFVVEESQSDDRSVQRRMVSNIRRRLLRSVAVQTVSEVSKFQS